MFDSILKRSDNTSKICTRTLNLINFFPGTGKTATFAIALMQRINFEVKETQGLVLAPTRELAQQIQKVIIALGDYLEVSFTSDLGCVPGLRPKSNNCSYWYHKLCILSIFNSVIIES